MKLGLHFSIHDIEIDRVNEVLFLGVTRDVAKGRLLANFTGRKRGFHRLKFHSKAKTQRNF